MNPGPSVQEPVLVVEVDVIECRNGLLARSPSLPGLHVLGIDRDALLADVPWAVKRLMREQSRKIVDVAWDASGDGMRLCVTMRGEVPEQAQPEAA